MARISIRTVENAPLSTSDWLSGGYHVRSCCSGAANPIDLDIVELEVGQDVEMTAGRLDRLGYVWDGAVKAGSVELSKGSSFILERGAQFGLLAAVPDTRIAVFSTDRARISDDEPGNIHLLPVERVPRVEGASAGGGLHANGRCGSNSMWLNENSLPGQPEGPAAEDRLRGVHAHPEDEIIFVTEGEMRLGTKLFPRGTALVIAADTLYGFSPGPQGVRFITFRPTGTTNIRFASGGDYAPSTYFDSIKTIPHLSLSACSPS